MLKFRTVLIVIGIFVLLRFIGKVMRGRREAMAREQEEKRRKAVKKRKEFIKKNEGKVFVIPEEKKLDESDIEDVSHEEMK